MYVHFAIVASIMYFKLSIYVTSYNSKYVRFLLLIRPKPFWFCGDSEDSLLTFN